MSSPWTRAAKQELDAAYHERNMLAALLARLYPSGIRKTAIQGWDEAWHNCVYIDLPTGQISFHYHDRAAALFDDLPPYEKEWDGHCTTAKWLRVARLREQLADAAAKPDEREVTEAMVRAGSLALSTWGIDSESLEEGATRIYLEMAKARNASGRS